MSNDYYLSQKRKLIKQLDKVVARVRPNLAARFGEAEAAEIHREILIEFERLLPEIPYIGGRKNSLTTFLIQSAWALAFYRVLQRRGGRVEDAGELLQQVAKAMFNATPKFLRHLFGRLRINKWRYSRMETAALETQKREYAGNWVQEFVSGDGKSFDFGFDFTECGIVKFMEMQDASELTPYLCQTDYAALEALGLKLERTETIASGCERCNFRIGKT
jgi:hypothetical protein